MSLFFFGRHLRESSALEVPGPIGVEKRLVRLKGCYKVYFNKRGKVCIVSADSAEEAIRIVGRAYPEHKVDRCFSLDDSDQIEVIAEI